MFSASKVFPTLSRIFFLHFRHKMDLKPPKETGGMTILDRALFNKKVQITCLTFKNNKLSDVLPVVKKYLLKLKKLKPVLQTENEYKILLNPETVKEWSNFSVEDQEILSNLNIGESNLKQEEYVLTYDNFSAKDIFKAVLPAFEEGMSSFTKIGHIVHVNLREHLIPYKQLIGEVLYDKTPNCRSVVNKTNMIDNTYRNFKMEVLKGDNDMLTTVKENNCSFKFDFSTVYWNSRLCTEHERIVKKLGKNDVLFDVFAGVGPFSLPAAKKGCKVYANDLNPESFKWLTFNAKTNKIKSEFFEAFNKDGRNFIREDVRKLLPQFLKTGNKIFITMNLPAMAVEFLGEFIDLLDKNEVEMFDQAPICFVYCFAKGEDPETIAKDLVVKNFGFDCSDKISEIFRVRTVSSMKEMMRVTISLDKDLLTGSVLSRKRKLKENLEAENSKERKKLDC